MPDMRDQLGAVEQRALLTELLQLRLQRVVERKGGIRLVHLYALPSALLTGICIIEIIVRYLFE
jgi:hypothetical protein